MPCLHSSRSPPKIFEFPHYTASANAYRAVANLVVRDGFSSFYFHPFLDLNYLKRTVEGIEALGYRFVSGLAVARAVQG
jgi:hypothetical protein